MKKCFKCGSEKPLSDFYKHSAMADGHVNKCKECNKKDVRENRAKKIDYYREYDKERGCRVDPKYIKWYRKTYPKKYAAHTAVNNAVRDGYLIPVPCERCGSNHKVHAHHDDYLRQLDVRWLCVPCHKEWHDNNGEGKNGK